CQQSAPRWNRRLAMSDIDALLRDLKKYGTAGRDCALSAEDALAVVAALEAAREDAERYRWLRHKLTCGRFATEEEVAFLGAKDGAAMDAFIDSAIAATGERLVPERGEVSDG